MIEQAAVAPKRIGLFLGVDPSAGGMFQYAQSLLNALSTSPREKYDVHVAYVGSTWGRIVAEYRFSAASLRLGETGLRMANWLMAAQVPGVFARALSGLANPIARQLKRAACDLWIFPAQDAISYQLNLPAIGTVHDLMHRYESRFPEVARGWRYRVREHRFSNLIAWSRGVLVDSDVGRAHVVESYGANAAKVHPLPYISPFYHSPGATSEGFDSRYALPRKFFLYPAQFWAHKNHITLITALATVRARCPDVHLVLTGGRNHEFDRIRTHVVALGVEEHVTFAGYVPEADLGEFYRRARALVMPTFFGPTNIPPLEALWWGCPAAVSRIYAMPEQLGDAVLYFDPRSAQEIAAVLTSLWLDDRLCEDLTAKGRERIASWGPAQFSERLQSIIDTVLNGGVS